MRVQRWRGSRRASCSSSRIGDRTPYRGVFRTLATAVNRRLRAYRSRKASLKSFDSPPEFGNAIFSTFGCLGGLGPDSSRRDLLPLRTLYDHLRSGAHDGVGIMPQGYPVPLAARRCRGTWCHDAPRGRAWSLPLLGTSQNAALRTASRSTAFRLARS